MEYTITQRDPGSERTVWHLMRRDTSDGDWREVASFMNRARACAALAERVNPDQWQRHEFLTIDPSANPDALKRAFISLNPNTGRVYPGTISAAVSGVSNAAFWGRELRFFVTPEVDGKRLQALLRAHAFPYIGRIMAGYSETQLTTDRQGEYSDDAANAIIELEEFIEGALPACELPEGAGLWRADDWHEPVDIVDELGIQGDMSNADIGLIADNECARLLEENDVLIAGLYEYLLDARDSLLVQSD